MRTSIPFFSIGITTYNRVKMLRETVASILGQTFPGFEAIVSNDNPKRKIDSKSLGIKDSRIRFINQTKNQGGIKNMNFLLKVSRGRYFTWLADDDLYHPDFLQSVHKAVTAQKLPPCVFTAYQTGNSYKFKKILSKKSQIFSGSKFLEKYLSRSLKTQGCYGVFKTKYLKNTGGIKQLGNSWFSPYSDNLLAIQTGLLKKVIFINSPLIFYRSHKGSISLVTPDLDAYVSAQKDLIPHCIKIFKNKKLNQDFDLNLFILLKWCIKDFTAVIRRTRSINRKQTIAYLKFLKKYMAFLKPDQYLKTIGFITKMITRLLYNLSKDKLKTLTK